MIWLAVIDNLEEDERTFHLLKRLALEGNVRNHLYSMFQIYILNFCNMDKLTPCDEIFCLSIPLLFYVQVFLPFPYSRSSKVLWRIFEKLFTDFRDCLNHVDYYDLLASAKSRFQPIPSTWLGY